MALYDYKGNNLTYAIYGNIADLSNYGDLSTARGFEKAWKNAVEDNSISGITIPIGNYDIEHTLYITRNNFSIYGNNATIHLRADNIHAIRMDYQNHILIDGLNFSMHQTKNTIAGTTFYIADCNYITIRNLSVFDIAVRGAMVLNRDATEETAGCTKILFDNLVLKGIGEPNLTEPNWPYGLLMVNVRDSTVRNCRITGISRTCIGLKNYVHNCYVINNHCEDGRHALALASDIHDAIKVSSDVTFIGNTVYNSEHPLWIGRTERFTVIGNILKGGQMYIENVFQSVFNSNIMDNTGSNSSLLRIDNCDNLTFCNNLYSKDANANLYELFNNPTKIYITGFMNGTVVNVVNPVNPT